MTIIKYDNCGTDSKFDYKTCAMTCIKCGTLLQKDVTKTINEALEYAIKVIRSYEMDIRNSESLMGIDLKRKGFCQGLIYREAIRDIKKRAGMIFTGMDKYHEDLYEPTGKK